jgi:hypothetical protein
MTFLVTSLRRNQEVGKTHSGAVCHFWWRRSANKVAKLYRWVIQCNNRGDLVEVGKVSPMST